MELQSTPIGGPELLILLLLFVFGLWWFLTFLPGKLAVTASAFLVSFSITPPQPLAPELQPVVDRTEHSLL